MSEQSSIDDEGGLPQAPEYSTEKDVASSPTASPPPAAVPTLSPGLLASSAASRVSLHHADNSADDKIKNGIGCSGSEAKRGEEAQSTSRASTASSRYSPVALRAMAEQRRLARQPQPQPASAAASPTLLTTSTGSHTSDMTFSATGREVVDVSAAQDKDDSPHAHAPDSPSSLAHSKTASPTVARRQSWQARRSPERASQEAQEVLKQVRIRMLFETNRELEGRNRVLREEGDELAEILRRFKLLIEYARPERFVAAKSVAKRPAVVEVLPPTEAPVVMKAPRVMANTSSASPLFTITTLYRHPVSAQRTALVPVPRGDGASGASAETSAERDGTATGVKPRCSSASFSRTPSAPRIKARPAILYVQLPPSWWMTLANGSSIVSAAIARVLGWLFDVCVLVVLLLCTVVLCALCDVIWQRVRTASAL